MDIGELLTSEMLALGSGDIPRFMELLEAKMAWVQSMQNGDRVGLDRDQLLDLWRRNRAILNSCRSLAPPGQFYRARP